MAKGFNLRWIPSQISVLSPSEAMVVDEEGSSSGGVGGAVGDGDGVGALQVL